MEIVESILPSDRFSNLPSGVAETILTFMPLRDAVRTSILSRRWRYVWTKLPQFVFNESLMEHVEGSFPIIPHMKIIFQLLLCHDGPIIKFTLSIPELKSCSEIDNFIFFLAKSQIEDLTVEMWKDCYSLPCSIFSCQKLRHLRLWSCSIRNSPSIGFSLLVSLKLIQVTIDAEAFARLISGSPLLSILEIESSSEVTICIDARNLKTIILNGLIKSINFRSVPVLSSVSIDLNLHEKVVNFVGLDRNITNFFDCFRGLKALKVSYQVVGSFDVKIPKRLPMSLVHLTHLKLSNISFNEMVELLFILCLIRSSPNLKYIEILIFYSPGSTSDETTSHMEGEDYSDIWLSELREVKMSDVTGTKPELEFIRLLLAKSPTLKKIEIQPEEASVVIDYGSKMLKEIIKFPRMSNEAAII